jgi:hypothetical protein
MPIIDWRRHLSCHKNCELNSLGQHGHSDSRRCLGLDTLKKSNGYGKGFAAALRFAATSYGGGTRAQIPTTRSPMMNSGVAPSRGPTVTD